MPRLSTRTRAPASLSDVVLCAALWLLAAETAILLPPRVSAVKWAHGRAAALAGTPAEPEWILWADSGLELRRIRVRTAVADVRALEVADFALDAGGTVHAVLYADLPLGRSARLLCHYPEQGEPDCEDLGELRCRLLAAAAPDSLWCLSTAPGGPALRRVSIPREGPRLWLPAEIEGPQPPTAGAGWLAAPQRDRAWLFVAQRTRLYGVDLRSGAVNTIQIPVTPGRHSLPGFAAHGTRLLALFPLDAAGTVERLDAPYGLFELTGRGWQRVAAGRSWMRGAAPAGMEERAVWIWNRAARRLERVELPEQPGP